jgi:hypothetical protein
VRGAVERRSQAFRYALRILRELVGGQNADHKLRVLNALLTSCCLFVTCRGSQDQQTWNGGRHAGWATEHCWPIVCHCWWFTVSRLLVPFATQASWKKIQESLAHLLVDMCVILNQTSTCSWIWNIGGYLITYIVTGLAYQITVALRFKEWRLGSRRFSLYLILLSVMLMNPAIATMFATGSLLYWIRSAKYHKFGKSIGIW